MLELRQNEKKERGFQNSGIANAVGSRLATDTLEQIWNRKNLEQSLTAFLRP
jgi:hypothetical protein